MKRNLLVYALLPATLGLIGCAGATGMLGSTPIGPEGSQGATGRESAADLLGVWRLLRMEKAGQKPVVPPADVVLTVEFRGDGRAHLVADCNRCNTGFTAGSSTIEVGLMACTRAYCPSAPLDADFESLVGSASSWNVKGAQLTLSSPRGSLLLGR